MAVRVFWGERECLQTLARLVARGLSGLFRRYGAAISVHSSPLFSLKLILHPTQDLSSLQYLLQNFLIVKFLAIKVSCVR